MKVMCTRSCLWFDVADYTGPIGEPLASSTGSFAEVPTEFFVDAPPDESTDPILSAPPTEPFCHSKPQSERCDRNGPGGFMGHTCAPTLAPRIGDWMQTATGRAFWPLDPRPDEIHIEDIAAALSKLCRYGGHCKRFYSVAEHCVLAATMAKSYPLETLMHDASEAYLSDVIRPIKAHLTNYKLIEASLESVIATRFSLQYPMPAEVKTLDDGILADERDQAMAPMAVGNAEWGASLPTAIGVTLQFWSPEKAEHEFLAAFRRYGGEYC